MTDDHSTIPLKKCTKCHREYPSTADYFFRDKKTKSGLMERCKDCSNPGYFERQSEKQRLHERGMKHCTKCGQEKPATLEYFGRDNRREHGLVGRCKVCAALYRKENHEHIAIIERQFRETHKQELSLYFQEYRRKNQAWINSKKSAYQKANRGKLNKYHRLYRIRNRERALKREAAWRKNHPCLSVYSHRRRARKLSLPDTFTEKHWLLCLDYWHGCCAVCGNQLRDLFGNVEPHADHWIALADKRPDNPGTVPENMICLCNRCNCSKKNNDPEQWLNHHFGKRKVQQILKRVCDYFEWIKQQ